MSQDVSARPKNLRDYVTQAAEIRSNLSERMTDLTASYNRFLNGGYEYGAGNPSLMGEGLPGMLQRYRDNETFVDVVREAFETADGNSFEGVITVDHDSFAAAFGRAAAARHLDPNALAAVGDPISVDDPKAWGQPETSGFVNDPVSAATGHFLEIEDEFVMPPRLAVLAWRRTYTSRNPAAGPHGRGWASWASAICFRRDDGTVVYQGPDGQLVTFGPGHDRVPGLPATLVEYTAGLALEWDWGSRHAGQRWEFGADGLVTTVTGPALGTTTFVYGNGRLAELVHDGGRRVGVEWVGDRIVALHASDGRSVQFRYSHDGDLLGSDRAADPRRYELDDAGRIVEVWDADGVRVCRNTYDADGRVTRQVSPFGRETVFTYLPGRRTIVSDTTDGPVTAFVHDAAGRLISLTNDKGQSYHRSFDHEGHCLAETGFDGAGTVRHFDDDGNLTGIDGPDGATERFAHDAAGRVVSHARPGRPATTFEYADAGAAMPSRIAGPEGWEIRIESVDGLVHRVTDADGVTVAMSYDGDGGLIRSTNGLGDPTEFRVHRTGQVAEVVAADGARVTCDVDDAGQVTAVRLPNGDVWAMEYSAAGRLRATVEPDGTRSEIEYGSHGSVERLIDALGGVVELRHDQLERLVGMTVADGAKWEYGYSAVGLLAMVGDPTGATWLYDYDPEGRLTAAVDPLGHRMRRQYDARGRLAAITDRNGSVTRFVRDEVGRLTGRVDTMGAETTYGYDGWDRPRQVVAPDGAEVTYRYTPAGRVREVRSAEGRGWTFAYDAAGRPVEVTDAAGATTRYEWDRCDRVVAVTQPSGRETRYQYDALGRPVTEIAGGFRWAATYDHAGRVVTRTDPLGAVTRFAYDRGGHLTEATDPLGRTIRFRYDERGNRVAVIDPFGSMVTVTYDAMRRVIATTDQLGRTTRITRDARGAVAVRALPTGQRLSVARDPQGWVTDVRVDDRDVLVTDRDVAGRPVLVHEPGANRTHRLQWSPGGRLVGLDTDGRRWAWDHDRDGALVRRVDPSGRTVGYERDRAGRVAAVRSDRWGEVAFERDLDGRLMRVRTAGSQQEWAYDERGLLVAHRTRRRAGATETVLVRDAAGRITEISEDGVRREFGYDAAGQLVAADGPGGRASWQYDEAGRLVHERGRGGVRTYHYDDAHQLSRIDGDGGTTTFAYDALGRRVQSEGPGGATRYEWDALDHLTGIERHGRAERVDVDAFGSLVAIGDRRLDWDIADVVSQLAAIDGTEVIAPLGLYLGTGSGTAVSWASTDWRGAPVATDPWGASDGGLGPSMNLAAGAFGELDVGGLTWLRNRVYDPATRAFLSCDPRPGIPGQTVTTNPYHYGANDPLGAVDPLGLEPVSIEQYKEIREQVGGVQWGNIAMVGLAAASFFIPGGPLIMAAVGAGIGAAPGIVNGITTGNWDMASIAKGAILGGAGGLVGGALGGRLAASLGSRSPYLVSAVTGASTGAVTSTGGELYDMVPGLPGADGTFDPESVLTGTVLGGAAGPLGYRLAGGRPPTAVPTNHGPGPQTTVVNLPETTYPHPVKPADAVDRWNDFLGEGPHTNTHPRTGLPDPDRIVSADGTRSVRYGDHEMGTGAHAGAKPSKHHYHEETWTYDPPTDTMTVENLKVNVPLPNN